MQSTLDAAQAVINYRFESLGAALSLHGTVLHFHFAGMIGAHAMKHFATALPSLIAGAGWTTPPSVYVSRLDRAILLMNNEQMMELFEDAPRGSVLSTPGAIVCRPCDLATMELHCWTLAHRGILRLVFTDVEPASAWAQERAQRSARLPARPCSNARPASRSRAPGA